MHKHLATMDAAAAKLSASRVQAAEYLDRLEGDILQMEKGLALVREEGERTVHKREADAKANVKKVRADWERTFATLTEQHDALKREQARILKEAS